MNRFLQPMQERWLIRLVDMNPVRQYHNKMNQWGRSNILTMLPILHCSIHAVGHSQATNPSIPNFFVNMTYYTIQPLYIHSAHNAIYWVLMPQWGYMTSSTDTRASISREISIICTMLANCNGIITSA